MELPIEGTGLRRFVAAASLAIAALLAFQASEVWLANRRISSQQLETVRSGANLLPGNGEAWDRVGRLEEYDFANSDPVAAIEAYQHALKDDPNSSYYWVDLGSAYELAGQDDRARHAYDQARIAYPLSGLVAWRYGNFLLRMQQYPEAFAEIQRSVRADPLILPLAISRVWRSTENVDQMLDHALPPDTDAYFQALDFFQSIHDVEPGLAVWHRLIALKKPFPLARAFPFLDELVSENRADDATQVWHEALDASGAADPKAADGSVIWDGDFTQDFSKGGLGWRWDPLLGAAIDFASAPPSHSGRSVRLDFSGGANLDLVQPAEFVPVEPSRTYHFRAEIRTEGITTESGVRFSVSDPHDGAVNSVTDNFTVSRPWTTVEADVKTGPNTHFLDVRLMRNQSRLFDNKLSGTAWVANISLVPSDVPKSQASR
jgi:tetratricopeptide (TPR) repeat protein